MSTIARSTCLVLFLSLGFYADAQDAPDGQAVFKSKCIMCHGADGQANTTMGRQVNAANLLSADVRKLSAEEMKQVVINGKGSMPSFTDQLSPEEIAAVVGYVRTLEKNSK